MDHLQRRVGFRHNVRDGGHQLGWNFEHLRAAIGHAEYMELQRYVKLATERDLGARGHVKVPSSGQRRQL